MLLVMRVNTVAWHVRCIISRGHKFADMAELLQYMVRACSDPNLHMRVRKQRHVVEPPRLPANAVLYRSDGAARGQGRNGEVRSGAGAVYFGTGAEAEAWTCVSLGDVSNNVAEYTGAIMVLERIVRERHAQSVLQMDSMLVVNQLNGQWRIVADDLRPLFREGMSLLNRIRRPGRLIDIQHVYREFNKDADEKANLGANGVTRRHRW